MRRRRQLLPRLTATRDESTRPICGFAALLVLQLLTSLSASIANAAEGIEQITVYSPPSERFAFDSVKIEVDSAPFPPNNIRELISRIPGVDANGKGATSRHFRSEASHASAFKPESVMRQSSAGAARAPRSPSSTPPCSAPPKSCADPPRPCSDPEPWEVRSC